MVVRAGLAAAGVLLAAACSGDPTNGGPDGADSDRADQAAEEVTLTPGPDGVQAVEILATDQFRFVPSRVNAHVGRIRMTLRIEGRTPHNVVFRTLSDVAIPVVSGSRPSSVDFTVGRPGEYRFVCALHEALNQTGTLVVTR